MKKSLLAFYGFAYGAASLIHAAETTVYAHIFVHGIILNKPMFNMNVAFSCIKDCLEGSAYAQRVAEIRRDPAFHAYQIMQTVGLQPIAMAYNAPVSWFARAYEVVNRESNAGESSDVHRYYTYGWPGLMSHMTRLRSAGEFYHELYAERERLRKEFPGARIHVRVIGFSHGGTVSLLMAAHASPEKRFCVDELILIGTPVQHETEPFILSPFFSHVYHVYSRADYWQKLDCFSIKRFCSRRRLHTKARKVTQIEVKVFKTTKRGKRGADRSPNHLELWFFGWVPDCYRASFPLYPFPIATFLPSLITQATRYFPHGGSLVCELLPDQDELCIRERHRLKPKKRVLFLSKRLLEPLRCSIPTL